MNELELLESMWAENVKRKTDLIVPKITFEGQIGYLNNGSWVFDVSYPFRKALDLKYEQRKKNKIPYMIWTQGPFLCFKEGDLIHSRDGAKALQVLSAESVAWEPSMQKMYQGQVVYNEYAISDKIFTNLNEHTCTQMQFLQLLIYGKYNS